MKLLVSLLRERVLNTLWFWPTVIVACGVFVSFAAVELDHAVGQVSGRIIFAGSPTSARVVTGTIAGSALSIIGITVPLTIVALQLASSQFSQRILRNFMRDRVVQIFLGAFIGLFVYNLLILRVIRSSDEGADTFVPQISITLGMILSVLSLGLFIIFVNHIVGLIQISQILRAIVKETKRSIQRLFPEQIRTGVAPERAPPPAADARVVLTKTSGYLNSAEVDALFELARDEVGTIWLVRNIGEFCAERTAVFKLSAGADRDALAERLCSKLQFGPERTLYEDPLFGFRQIVDVAARALSPGVNDPTTAIQCVDHLSDLLHTLLQSNFPSVVRKDEDGVVRLVVQAPSFEDFVAEAFDQIRLYAEGDVAVTRRALQVLAELASHSTAPERTAAFSRQSGLFLSGARRSIKEPADLASLERVAASRVGADL